MEAANGRDREARRPQDVGEVFKGSWLWGGGPENMERGFGFGKKK